MPDYNIAVEYQGKQHYEPVGYFGGENHFNMQKKHDDIKRKYCIDNGIYLLEIPYWDIDSIDEILDDTFNLHKDIV